MDSKKRVLGTLQKSRTELETIIYMVENDQDCLKIHLLLKNVINELQRARKDMLRQHLDNCLNKLYKHNTLGNKARKEVINLFQT